MYAVPKQYEFLNQIGALPKILQVALQYIALKEYPGVNNNNPVIMAMAKELGIADLYPNDETAWCALFMCHVLKLAGKPMPYTKYEIVRAASFRGGGSTEPQPWGDKVRKGDERLGDIICLSRPGGDHVTIYIAETKDTFIGFGGNQGNMVKFSEFEKDRVVDVRRYYEVGPPASAKKYFVKGSGIISVNEA